VGGVKLAAFFNVNLAVSVDQDVGDFIIPQKRLQRPKTQQLVLDLLDQVILVDVGEQASLVVQNGGDRRGDFLRRERRLEAFKPGNVQHLEQPVVDRKLELLKTLGLHVFDGALLIAYQRALKRCRRCAVLLRNSLDQLHSVTSSARADYIQQARNQCIWGSAVAGFAAHLEPPRQVLDALGQRRVRRHLPQILRAQLHALENFFIARNPGVNRLRQGMAQLLFTDRMTRHETAQNEVGFDSRQPQPPHQIDESPRASCRADRLVEQVEQMTRALPGGDRVCVDMGAAIHDHEVEQLARQIEDRTDRLVTDQLAVLDPLGRREQVDSRRMLAERRFELNRIKLSRSVGERHDRALGFEIQEDRHPAGLQVEVDYRYPLFDRVAQRQREIRGQARHSSAAYQAHQRNDRAAAVVNVVNVVNFFAPAGLAYLQQCAGHVAGIQRQKQKLIGSGPQHPLHQVWRTIAQQRK